MTEHDLSYLRRAIALASEAKARGKHPFGAVVVASNGEVLAEAVNAFGWPDGDATGHAELIAVREASRRFPPQRFADATLYTSAEPCAMCAGAAYWSGISRVVYALSEERLLAMTGNHPENPTLSLPREVFARGQRRIEVIGPVLEDEAAAAHLEFWT
jgi:tRNA(Arg) A34 adenosine deaminase TadA